MHYEVPIVVGFARRLKDKFQFQLAMQDVILPENWKGEDDPLKIYHRKGIRRRLRHL